MLACANYKEKGSIVHQFTCFCMENHLWKFQPKQTPISWDMNENINKENKKNSGFGEALQLRSHTFIIVFSSDYFFQTFSNIWVSVTSSDNSFTISPHNLALLHSTLLHSNPVPLRVCSSALLKRAVPEGYLNAPRVNHTRAEPVWKCTTVDNFPMWASAC